MTEYEKWYQFCMLCKYAYKRKDDADTGYCLVLECYCPHKKEIEDAERGLKNERIRR